jgi:surface carbohydrate biosynthesis protein (TIGR04326 family)
MLLTDFLSFSVWLRAVVAWLQVQRRWSMRRIETAVPSEGDLGRLWPRWKPLLHRSIVGSHAVRTAILTEMFAQVIRSNRETKVWVTAFEGQSWESCLARVLEHHDVAWVPYLHTMMRPWDLRAHTFLAEQPPKRLALHGPHDKSELQTTIDSAARRSTRQSTKVTDVEALRYQHLSASASESHQPESASAKEATWLVVGGADCELSSRELQAFVSTIQAQSVRAKIVVRWHPQCQLPEWVDRSEITVSQEPLGVLALRSNAALMIGLAAPLDTYLAGVPSCSFVAQSGLAMSPIEENEYHHLALDAADAVRWMQKFEGSARFVAEAERFFNFGEDLTRWRELIFSLAR